MTNLINWIDEISPDWEEKNTVQYTQEAPEVMKANHRKLIF